MVLIAVVVPFTAQSINYETIAAKQASANANTVRTHRKLRRAGVEADLNVYEGQSHAQFDDDLDAPETKEAITDIANFFDKHLGK